MLRQTSFRGFFVVWNHRMLPVMKRVLLLLAGLLFGSLHLAAQDLDSLLRVIHDRDQAVRAEVVRLSQQVPPSVDSLLAAYGRMQTVDAENQRVVSELLEGGGWPEGISDEAGETIWLVIDHADLEMQRRWMPLIEAQMAAGRVSKSSYATLLDRMLMREKRGRTKEYYAVPEIFGRQKGRAEVFEKQIRRALGRFRMVYTRTPEGRKILLRARTRSFVNQNQRVLQGRKVAKGTFE